MLRAMVQTSLAEAYLADGKVPEAREVVIAAIDVLDQPVPVSNEQLRASMRRESVILLRPAWLKERRWIYRRPDLNESNLMVARLYEHLGRAAYLLDEQFLHDFAVMRCLNLATVLRRWALRRRLAPDRLRPFTEQLSKAYAAACLVRTTQGRSSQAKNFSRSALSLAEEIKTPPALALYIHMLFGMSQMQASSWRVAESSLRGAVLAASKTFVGRRGEEASNQLAVVLYMSGDLEEAQNVCEQARELCLSRHDPPMLANLTNGMCLGLLHSDRHLDAHSLLEDLKLKLPEHLLSTAAMSNACGMLAICHLRAGRNEQAREQAEAALSIVKAMGNNKKLSTFWGFALAIEVLLRLLSIASSGSDTKARSKQERLKSLVSNGELFGLDSVESISSVAQASVSDLNAALVDAPISPEKSRKDGRANARTRIYRCVTSTSNPTQPISSQPIPSHPS